MTAVDRAFVSAVVQSADDAVEVLRRDPVPLRASPFGAHRESMRRAKLLVAAFCSPDSAHAGDRALVELAEDCASELSAMQSASGLFMGGDNVESPPDSGFTIADLGDILELIARAEEARAVALVALGSTLAAIAERATAAMISGGVHTPNHRWELSGALARLHRHRPDAAIRRRIEEWLAEGIDIDTDGLYSERSPNYAAHVSNPSLLAIGDVLGAGHLHDAVERNLDATLGLIHPDGSVETVHSRRQDQKSNRFPLAGFLTQYRRFAVERGRGDFAWAARRALEGGIADPQTALAELLLHPSIASELPSPVEPAAARVRSFPGSSLVVDSSPKRTLVVYAGSDYPAARRIRSGLANNPTFLRVFAEEAVLDSVRLSRDFFGLGPFRPSRMDGAEEGYVLTEELDGRYYQPLRPAQRRDDGAYDLLDEGRFSAAMSFDRRASDAVRLRTTVEVRPLPDGVELRLDCSGPSLGWALELAFRPGGVFENVIDLGDDRVALVDGVGRYLVGDACIEFGPGTGVSGHARYSPGEDYEYLGGTDAAAGPRAYLTGRVPDRHRVVIRSIATTLT